MRDEELKGVLLTGKGAYCGQCGANLLETLVAEYYIFNEERGRWLGCQYELRYKKRGEKTAIGGFWYTYRIGALETNEAQDDYAICMTCRRRFDLHLIDDLAKLATELGWS